MWIKVRMTWDLAEIVSTVDPQWPTGPKVYLLVDGDKEEVIALRPRDMPK